MSLNFNLMRTIMHHTQIFLLPFFQSKWSEFLMHFQNQHRNTINICNEKITGNCHSSFTRVALTQHVQDAYTLHDLRGIHLTYLVTYFKQRML